MNISIITVNRNNAPGLRKTIESVITQTTPPFEFIIIDGGSTDESVSIIQERAGSFTFWVSEPDDGIYNAMNKGTRMAHGEWCLFINSGDTFASPTVLEQIQNSGASADLICGNTILLDNPPRRETPPSEITLNYMFNNALCHQSVLIRRNLLEKYPYDESLKIVADRKFFLQTLIINNASYQTIDIDISNYDMTGISSTQKVTRELEYASVLESMLPPRIRQDYGRQIVGSLYGDTLYEKMFAEIGRRNWRTPIYHLVRGLLLCLAPFEKRARFIRDIK
ncbi:MAG: glycosyltransferase [Bacteroidales bacterium]|nr:glycosyltransferase [Bacteroidales bacterium]